VRGVAASKEQAMYAEDKRHGEAFVGPRLLEGNHGLAGAHDLDAGMREELRRLLPAPAPAVAEPSAQPATATPAEARPHAAPKRSKRKLAVLALALLLGGSTGGYFGYHWWTVGRFTVSTDDAYVRASNTTLAAKIPGYVSAILVDDNASVHAGDVIATIDNGDYKLAVDAARDKVATQQATVARIGRQIVAQQASVAQARAQVVSAQAAAKRAESELARQQALAARDYASKQTLEQALANRDQANAAVQSAEAALDAASANVDVLKGQAQEAERVVAELKTALAKAERDLSFTLIRAPVDGVMGNRAVQTGDYVQPGQRVAALVPLDDVYIDANFKETQLAGLKPGQPVSISVDALPDRTIEGTLASVSPASGSVFSLLPPDNATGNFTKIVQRLPVRVHVPPSVAMQRVLRPGMSVVVSVDTRKGPAPAHLARSGH
jgi:membrane fusion protein (multidrug efflux system)